MTEAGTVTVVDGIVPTSEEETLPPGTYYWQASYSGDAHNHRAVGACGEEVSTVKSSISLGTELSNGSEARSVMSVLEGGTITDRAYLSGAESSTAEGTVTYDVYSDAKCESLAVEAGTVSVSGGTAHPSSEEALPVGTYYWQAKYSGDAHHEGATSACGSEIEMVQGKTLLTTSLSGEGQTGDRIQVANSAVKDSAQLSGTNSWAATGTVSYKVYSDNRCEHLVADAGEVEVHGEYVAPTSQTEDNRLNRPAGRH